MIVCLIVGWKNKSIIAMGREKMEMETVKVDIFGISKIK